MKAKAKQLIASVLGYQVRSLRKRNPSLKLIGVAGSYGKTGTKLAVAAVLSEKFRVRYQSGNYNDLVSVPLVFFGEAMPNLFNPFAWLWVVLKNQLQIWRPYPFDVVVLELGTDGPRQIEKFGNYLVLDLAIMTSIAREHMEFFRDVDAVATEELSVTKYAAQLLINSDLCDKKYLAKLSGEKTYGFDKTADFHIQTTEVSPSAYRFSLKAQDGTAIEAVSNSPSKAQVYSVAAAATVAHILGMTASEISVATQNVTPTSGRMQLLDGIKRTTIWDETYNASPEAVKGALDTLYQLPASYRTALLGSMNELGSFSAAAHQEVGEYCLPEYLDLVVTLGAEANRHLAPAAKQKGCTVIETTSPYEAALVLRDKLPEGSLLLAKGSQNGVFAEEAVKYLLADPSDSSKLVRQSHGWLKQKHKAFGNPPEELLS